MTKKRDEPQPETLAGLTPDPENRRAHPTRNLEMIGASLREVGPGRSIVIDEAGSVLAGNGVVTAAQAMGLSKVIVVDGDRETIVAVRRTDLTAAEKRALAIADNRTGELAEWDWTQIAADEKAGLDLSAWFTEAELAAGISGLEPPAFAPAGVDEQHRLDQQHPITCPNCGHEFHR